MRMLLGLAVAATIVGTLLAGCGPEANCLALPVCEQGEVESQTACASGETTCRTVAICGQAIFCRPGAADAGP